MTLAYLLCVAASITILAVLLLRPHPAPTPPTTTPQAQAMATDAARLDALGTLLRAAADQITTYRPAA